MSLFKSLCSLFTSSGDERSNNTNAEKKIESNPPAVEKPVSTPDKNSDSLISEYVFDGEVKIGTQITVNPLELLVFTKDGVMVDLLQQGVYVVNESILSKFTSGVAYTVKLTPCAGIRWGTNTSSSGGGTGVNI